MAMTIIILQQANVKAFSIIFLVFKKISQQVVATKSVKKSEVRTIK